MLLSQKMQVSILSTNECYWAAEKKLYMPDNMCDSALKLLGEMNIVFYRPNILKEVVFLMLRFFWTRLQSLYDAAMH